MAGRASIVGAAATHVGNVRDHNEDAHFIDCDLGVFLVCDGMGGHAAGEVASDLAIRALREQWGGAQLQTASEEWLERGTPEAKKRLLDAIRAGVIAAHDSILAEADRDETKSGMGTTLVGAVMVGGDLVFAHAGDSRAYLVRDGISMQLTEDHTLLARLLAAGIDVDVSGEGSRFRSMLTNALGIGDEVKVSTFVVPLADGDRFLLCSDGVSEYVPENEVGDVLTKQPSPARAAQRLIDLALERGGGDNATAVVVRVLEAGETPLPAEQRKKDDAAINACALWARRVTPQQRLRALRIAIPRDHNFGEKLPPYALGDRVAWLILEGELVQDGVTLGPGALIYPESLLSTREAAPPPERDALAITRSDVRALAIRADDFRELCEDDGELGEALLDSLATMVSRRRPRASSPVDPRSSTDPQLPAVPREASDAYYTGGDPAAFDEPDGDDDDDRAARDRAATIPDEPTERKLPPRQRRAESSVIAPAPPRPAAAQPPARPSPPPPQIARRTGPPPPPPPRTGGTAPSRPSPPPDALQPPARPSPPPDAVSRAARPAPSGAEPAGRAARPPPPPPEPRSHAAPPAPSAPEPTGHATRPVPPEGEATARRARPTPPPPEPMSHAARPAPSAPEPTGHAGRPVPPEGEATARRARPTPPPPEPMSHAARPAHAAAASTDPAAPEEEPTGRRARPTPPPPEPMSQVARPTPPPGSLSRPTPPPGPGPSRSTSPPAEPAARSTPAPGEPAGRSSSADLRPRSTPAEPAARSTATPGAPPPRPTSPADEPRSRSSSAQPPSRPSPPPVDAPQRAQRPSAPPPPPGAEPPSRAARPAAPAAPWPSRPSPPPASRTTPTPAQAQAAAALPHRATPARGIPRAQTPAQGVSRVASPAQGVPSTPGSGVAPPPGEAAKPASPAAAPPATRSGSWAATTPRARGESPWDPQGSPGGRGDPAFDRTAGSPPRGFARALTPPGVRLRATTPAPLPPVDADDLRTPTDPEIETFLELEAELPPAPGAGRDAESERALRRALADDLDGHESVSITIEEEGHRVIETTTEMDGHTLTVTVTEPYGLDERQRAITAEDGHEVSGSISIPEDTPPPPLPRRRLRRQSEGWEE